MKSQEELRQLHGQAYVDAFRLESPKRLTRLLPFIDLDPAYHVVDFGCGDGLLMELIADRVRSYTGVDFSEPFIRAAEQRKAGIGADNAQFVCSDITNYCAQFADRFDVAFAMDFSEHVYDENWLDILKSMHHCLKPGGRLFVHTPNADFVLEQLKSRNLLIKQFPAHIAVRSPDDNAAMINRAGFRIEKIRLLPHYNFLRHLHPLSFLPLIGKYFKARILIEARK